MVPPMKLLRAQKRRERGLRFERLIGILHRTQFKNSLEERLRYEDGDGKKAVKPYALRCRPTTSAISTASLNRP